jgi:hypothetical protein
MVNICLKSAVVILGALTATSCSSSKTSATQQKTAAPASAVGEAGSVSATQPPAQAPAAAGTAGQCGDGIFPTLCVDVAITGRSPLAGTTTALAIGKAGEADTCEQWALGFEGALEIPVMFAPVNGTDFAMGELVKPYAGPGSYSADVLSGRGAPFSVTVGKDTYSLETGPATFKVNADGSGNFTFDGFTSSADTQPRPAALSGTVQWTCSNPK